MTETIAEIITMLEKENANSMTLIAAKDKKSYFIKPGDIALIQTEGKELVSVIYQFDHPSGFLKTIIHFCVGMSVFYPIAIYLGWIPFHSDKIFFTVLQFLSSCVIFMAIWFYFYLFHRNEAKKLTKD